MRLLNVHTLEIETFKEAAVPPFAIASHRWSADETSFGEVSGRNLNSQGADKIKILCNFVIKHPLPHPTRHDASLPIRWLWVDTCE